MEALLDVGVWERWRAPRSLEPEDVLSARNEHSEAVSSTVADAAAAAGAGALAVEAVRGRLRADFVFWTGGSHSSGRRLM